MGEIKNRAEHTPGPWEVAYDGPSRPIIVTGEIGTMLTIGKLERARGVPYEREDADARLIAAAPDMLSALEAIRARINGEWDHPALAAVGPLSTNTNADVIHIAEQAIKRARA